jgi:putative DeoR family transcriptional regulator (stage III sporulation protein D)
MASTTADFAKAAKQRNVRIEIITRAITAGKLIVETGCTIRELCGMPEWPYSVSKSTVWIDVTRRLRRIDPALADEVAAQLSNNWADRQARGGAALQAIKRQRRLEEATK